MRSYGSQALTHILLYHVLGGSEPKAALTTKPYPSLDTPEQLAIDVGNGTFTVNKFSVISADNAASNGYVHVIDDILVPANAGLPAADSKLSQYLDDPKLFDTAGRYKDFAQFGGVYADYLDNPNTSVTAFAPALGGWDKLPAVLARILKAEEKLGNSTVIAAFMKYQLVDGVKFAKDVLNAPNGTLTTLEGETISVRVMHSVTGDKVYIGDVLLVNADYAVANNGIFHTLESYLVPEHVDGLPSQTVVKIAGEDSIFTAAARQAAKTKPSLDPDAPANKTVFVPSDAAFLNIATKSQLDFLLTEDPSALASLVSEHFVPAIIFDDELVNGP